MTRNSRLNGSNAILLLSISFSSIFSRLFDDTRIATDPDVNKRRKQTCTTEKNTEGGKSRKIHYVSDRNHWVRQTTYSIRVLLILGLMRERRRRRRERKKTDQKMYKSKTNKQKKKTRTLFFAFRFYQTRSGCITCGSFTLFTVHRQSADERRKGIACTRN